MKICSVLDVGGKTPDKQSRGKPNSHVILGQSGIRTRVHGGERPRKIPLRQLDPHFRSWDTRIRTWVHRGERQGKYHYANPIPISSHETPGFEPGSIDVRQGKYHYANPIPISGHETPGFEPGSIDVKGKENTTTPTRSPFQVITEIPGFQPGSTEVKGKKNTPTITSKVNLESSTYFSGGG